MGEPTMSEKTILLVEDNPDDIALTLRAFEKYNVANKIHVSRNGVEALDFLFSRGEFEGADCPLPQLILLDLKLPRLSGLETLREIRSNERTRYVPVVVLTSSSEQEDLIRSYDLGANSFVQKPVDFNEFVEATKQLGLFWLVFNKTPIADR
jgi:two-component system response regulator